MEEFGDRLLPESDARHRVVEQVVQHLARRNQDLPEMADVDWSVHVVQSDNTNAFVLPVGDHTRHHHHHHHHKKKSRLKFIFGFFGGGGVVVAERQSVHVHRHAGSCGRCPPAHHRAWTRNGSCSTGTRRKSQHGSR